MTASALLLLWVFCAPWAWAETPEAPPAGEVALRFEEGEARLLGDARAQSRLGIETAPLVRERHRAERACSAEVIALAELLATRAELAGLDAERAALLGMAKASRQQASRLQAARQAGAAVAPNAIPDAELAANRSTADAAAVAARADVLKIRLQSAWGQSLLAFLTDTPRGRALTNGRGALLRVNLPPEIKSAALPRRVYVGTTVAGAGRRFARVIGRAPQTGPWLGTALWAVAPGAALVPGMRPEAWVAEAKAREGHILPASALVWAQGRRWVYVALAGEDALREFQRRAVDGESLPEGRVFTAQTFPPGARLVIVGAHALLAEEMRGTIPEEDDD